MSDQRPPPEPQPELPAELSLASIIEAVLLAAGRPLKPEQIARLFPGDEQPSLSDIRQALEAIVESCAGRGLELVQVASGWRLQIRSVLAPWIARLWEERPPRYSRALLETLALIAYRQPTTRGEIEEVRGVAVSTQIVRTLLEREWVRVVGHKEVPGRPALYATTQQFLDYFNLESLGDLPPLPETGTLSGQTLPGLDEASGAESSAGGALSPVEGALSQVEGALSPGPVGIEGEGALSPDSVEGAPGPVEGAPSPAEGALSQVEGALSPGPVGIEGEGALSPDSVEGAPGPVEGAPGPVEGALSPEEGAPGPVKGALSPPATAPDSPDQADGDGDRAADADSPSIH